jgi:hypothetical protein
MNKKILFTVCTVNYLAYAKAMADSFMRFNPDYKIIIGLVDRIDKRFDPATFQPYEIIEAESLHSKEFPGMVARYTALELSCAMKSFFARYILDKYSPSTLVYVDGDVLFFDSIGYVEKLLAVYSITLTPHIFSPFPFDKKRPQEKEILKTGLYNAGFFALRNDNTGNAFINWWGKRMIDQCYYNGVQGWSVDQNWLNLVPIYFDQVGIVEHRGYNVAYWNIHERNLSVKGNRFYVNENEPLIFFHYSGYNIGNVNEFSKHQDRVQMTEYPELVELHKIYRDAVLKSDHSLYSALNYSYKKKSFWKRFKG